MSTTEKEVQASEIVETGNLPVPAKGEVVAIVQPDDEWGDVESGDLAPDADSRISLLSYNAKLDGGFANPDTGELGRELDFVWLAKSKSRAWFSVPFGQGDGKTDCRSFDGVTPDATSRNLQATTCAECPRSLWDGDTPPACGEAIEAFIFIPAPMGFGRLARVRFGGLAIGPARDYWRSFSERLPKRPPIGYVSRATLEETLTKNGTFFRPRFERIRELTRGEAQPLIDEREKYLAEWQSHVETDIVEGVVGDQRSGDDGASNVEAEFNEEPF